MARSIPDSRSGSAAVPVNSSFQDLQHHAAAEHGKENGDRRYVKRKSQTYLVKGMGGRPS
jgi:hypothetical protein